MYMPGRLRTASRPSRTVIEEAPYSGTEVPTAAWAAGSCLVVPFKGFLRSFLTRTPLANKPVACAKCRTLQGNSAPDPPSSSALRNPQASARGDPVGRVKIRPRLAKTAGSENSARGSSRRVPSVSPRTHRGAQRPISSTALICGQSTRSVRPSIARDSSTPARSTRTPKPSRGRSRHDEPREARAERRDRPPPAPRRSASPPRSHQRCGADRGGHDREGREHRAEAARSIGKEPGRHGWWPFGPDRTQSPPFPAPRLARGHPPEKQLQLMRFAPGGGEHPPSRCRRRPEARACPDPRRVPPARHRSW